MKVQDIFCLVVRLSGYFTLFFAIYTIVAMVLEGEGVSRRHAEVTRDAGGFSVRDVGSRNGTIVNGRKVKRPTTLKRGDSVSLGKVVLEVRDL